MRTFATAAGARPHTFSQIKLVTFRLAGRNEFLAQKQRENLSLSLFCCFFASFDDANLFSIGQTLSRSIGAACKRQTKRRKQLLWRLFAGRRAEPKSRKLELSRQTKRLDSNPPQVSNSLQRRTIRNLNPQNSVACSRATCLVVGGESCDLVARRRRSFGRQLFTWRPGSGRAIKCARKVWNFIFCASLCCRRRVCVFSWQSCGGGLAGAAANRRHLRRRIRRKRLSAGV